jgi:hypothetical protein
MISLLPFCDENAADSRLPGMVRPWKEGSFVYATDAAILVRVNAEDFTLWMPATELVPAHCGMLIEHALKIRRWEKWPKIPTCRRCDNTGHTFRACADCTDHTDPVDDECVECIGTGKVTTHCDCTLALGKTHLALRYAELCSLLPDARWAQTTEEDRIAFKFTGGYGVVMGIIDPRRVLTVGES